LSSDFWFGKPFIAILHAKCSSCLSSKKHVFSFSSKHETNQPKQKPQMSSTSLQIIFLTLISTVNARAIASSDDIVVRTSLGAIRGVEQHHDGVRVRAFLGVPFAKKPTGIRRFTKPEMINKWEGELLATEPARTCTYTIDTMFPLFPGAEMWNPPNVSSLCILMNSLFFRNSAKIAWE
jgi:hypothetical protein